MRQWYDILGVDDGADRREIRRAYARALKRIDQETNPQEFMQLREAYDFALDAIEYNRDVEIEQNDNEQDENVLGEDKTNAQKHDLDEPIAMGDFFADEENKDETETEPEPKRRPGLRPEPKPEPEPDTATILVKKAFEMVFLPWTNNDIDSWQKLLDDDRFDDLQVYRDFEHALLNWLLIRHGYFDDNGMNESYLFPMESEGVRKLIIERFTIKDALPMIGKDVARFIFSYFGWDEKRNIFFINSEPFDFLAGKFFFEKTDQPYINNTKHETDGDVDPSYKISNWLILALLITFFIIIKNLLANL